MSTATTSARHSTAGDSASAPLRVILRIDAWGTAVFGVVLLACCGLLSGPLGLPTSWSVPFGVAMLGGAAALGLIAGYPSIPARHAVTVVAGNALSCVAMLVLTFSGLIPLTGPGIAFMLVGALVVGIFAGLELRGTRRMIRAGDRAGTA
ncbi:hypothetical protein [Streptoalloteichus hindustanus]|uniref:Uncharacterized protein n=1 Tax=Streptoalloteichus hindustanus TaxID=2017 RepID=A0A1M4Z5M2_STRHI|nr:hypothetical protein [Streptoalloteichus hindustanus]SHF13285.1 hypothetical protein SAMN05444320_102609 [Streptoalloteichus hindustanus]